MLVLGYQERLDKGIDKMAVAHADNIGYYQAHHHTIIGVRSKAASYRVEGNACLVGWLLWVC
jgi:hypothetical protein